MKQQQEKFAYQGMKPQLRSVKLHLQQIMAQLYFFFSQMAKGLHSNEAWLFMQCKILLAFSLYIFTWLKIKIVLLQLSLWETCFNYKLEYKSNDLVKVQNVGWRHNYLGILYNVSIRFFQSTFHLHGTKTFWKSWCVINFSTFFSGFYHCCIQHMQTQSSVMEVRITWELQYND